MGSSRGGPRAKGSFFRGLHDRLADWASFGGPSVPLRSRAISLLFVAVCPWLWHFVWPPLSVTAILVGARVLTGFLGRSDWRLRAVGWAALPLVLFFHVFSWFVAIAMALALGWTVPVGVRVLVAALLAARLAGGRWPGGIRVTSMVALAVFIRVCGNGGFMEAEHVVECDDYLSVRAPAEVVVPSRKDLPECRPGMKLPLGRFPRFAWDFPDGRRYLFTSQAGRDWRGPPAAVDTVTGLLCETPASGTSSPRCMGGWVGRSQRIQDVPGRGEILVGVWEQPPVVHRGGARDGRIMAVSAADPMKTVDRLDFPNRYCCGDLLYQPAHRAVWAFGDLRHDRLQMERYRRSDWAELPGGPMKVFMFGRDYDPVRDEGVLCGLISPDGRSWTNFAAFHGEPPQARRLVASASAPSLVWGLATGCAFDPGARKAYVMMMNFGVLARFDFDTGRLEKRKYVGIGVRNLTYDARRRRIYATEFLNRDVVAIDADTLEETGRWRVGRFARDVRLTHDGGALLVGTTVGLVRVRLDP